MEDTCINNLLDSLDNDLPLKTRQDAPRSTLDFPPTQIKQLPINSSETNSDTPVNIYGEEYVCRLLKTAEDQFSSLRPKKKE